MRSEFEKWFKTTEVYESFIRYWNEEQVFRTGEDGEYLDSTVNSHLKAWQHQQSKVDELERIIEIRDKQLTEEIGLSTKYVGKFDELQKRVDAVKQLIKDYKDPTITSDKSFQHGLLLVADELEQALKGKNNEF